jgi:hypothetical protein
MTNQERARRALQKHTDKMDLPDDAGWDVDKEDDKTYTWTYQLPDGTRAKLVYVYSTKTITRIPLPASRGRVFA